MQVHPMEGDVHVNSTHVIMGCRQLKSMRTCTKTKRTWIVCTITKIAFTKGTIMPLLLQYVYTLHKDCMCFTRCACTS